MKIAKVKINSSVEFTLKDDIGEKLQDIFNKEGDLEHFKNRIKEGFDTLIREEVLSTESLNHSITTNVEFIEE